MKKNGEMRIFLVDDDVDICTTYKAALEDNGFQVDIYTDPIVAISNYKTGYYDLLLLDIRMPKMTGFELYDIISKLDQCAKLKVCFITSFEVYYRSIRENYPHLTKDYHFIQKPISIADLVKHLKKIVCV